VSRRSTLPVLFGVLAVVAISLLNLGRIESRAESALGRGMPAREAELARGFVLGRDERIDPQTVDDFRRAGLSHLLAVSGENVTLLALLAMPLLAALGIGLRERLLWVLGLIVVYVPLTGAGPSIQRAGVMGAMGVLATLAGRRASRLYALAVAAVLTLAIDPRVAGDVGWQLSFAAVLGILLLAAPLRAAIAARIGARSWRGALAEGAAVTISATLATAPLIAYDFGTVSTATLAANLLAMPAVAPAMWLGMASSAAGQIPGFPVEAFNAINALLLGYVAQVAAWCGRPGWAYLHMRLGLAGLVASYLGLAMAVVLAFRLAHRRRIAMAQRASKSLSSAQNPRRCNAFAFCGNANALHRRRRALPTAIAVGMVAMGVLVLVAPGGGAQGVAPIPGLRIEVLDVGQGDSILLQPARASAILVDGGPPDDGLAAKLHAAGVDRLGAVVVTHYQSDHAGGIEELFGRFPIQRLVYAQPSGRLLDEARAAGVSLYRVAQGNEIRSGDLRLDAIWPPGPLTSEPLAGADPNDRAIVAIARWHRFSMLLTADAEAEAVPIDPGPIDVLKVAHHGSDDAGLGSLLDRTRPRLAVISVGADNPYGHPTPNTLATLAAHGIRTLRTDRDGTVSLDVIGNSVWVDTGG
jgi:competence protein ComEC